MSAAKHPSLWVFAGPNGAGKSSLTEKYRVKNRVPIVNPDVIKLERNVSEAEAGKQALAERAAYLSARRSFAIETTLSGNSEISLMRRANQSGYKISFVFIGLVSPIQSQMRVAERVQAGGHDVPDSAIMRRYGKAMANFALAKTYANHRIIVFDNSGDDNKRLLWRWESGADKYRAGAEALPDWVKKYQLLSA